MLRQPFLHCKKPKNTGRLRKRTMENGAGEASGSNGSTSARSNAEMTALSMEMDLAAHPLGKRGRQVYTLPKSQQKRHTEVRKHL